MLRYRSARPSECDARRHDQMASENLPRAIVIPYLVAISVLIAIPLISASAQEDLPQLRALSQDQLQVPSPSLGDLQPSIRTPDVQATARTITRLQEMRATLLEDSLSLPFSATFAIQQHITTRMTGPDLDVWSSAPVTHDFSHTLPPSDYSVTSTEAMTPDDQLLPLDDRINVHMGALVGLKFGEPRGRVTLPLWQGRIRGTGRRVYFLMTDATDADFANAFGILYSPGLASAAPGAVDLDSRFDGKSWEFPNDPGLVARDFTNGAQGNPDFTPLKQIQWRHTPVIINISFIKWGESKGQSLIIDLGRCQENIRKSPLGQAYPYQGGGPSGCEDDTLLKPQARFQGGQLLEINTKDCASAEAVQPCGNVTMKLHRMVHRTSEYPYLIILATSDKQRSEQLGVPHVPRLRQIGTLYDTNSIGAIVNFKNGIRAPDGGMDRFQLDIVSYSSAEPGISTYTPILQSVDVVFDCNYDKKIDASDLSADCPAMAKRMAANATGQISFNQFQSPRLPLYRIGERDPLLLNAPAPVSVEP